MKVVIAPNALKGSLTALDAAQAMAAGVLKALPQAETVLVPVADGGDGLTEVLTGPLQGKLIKELVTGPITEKVSAEYCYIAEQKTAVIEIAAASGIALLKQSQYCACRSSTYGTGELVKAALAAGAKKIIIGLGGSATCDGATGLAAALGVRFLGANNQEIEPCGQNLINIKKIEMSDLPARLAGVKIIAACDVDNPLLGPTGSAYVYAPQKGATPQQVVELEAGLKNLAAVLKRDLQFELTTLPGAGAAGGAGAGVVAFLGAELQSGIDIVFELTGLAERMRGADLVLTAEGQLDGQTAFGKAPAGVSRLAAANNIPCLAFGGSIQDLEELNKIGITAAFSICAGPVSLDEAIEQAKPFLTAATEQAMRAFLI
jgi:glycerate kinase